MFENKEYMGIYYSRFIASWMKMGGKINYKFKRWLRSLIINNEQIPDEIIQEIYNFADNGKLELQEDAAKFLAADKQDDEKRLEIAVNLKTQAKLLEHANRYAERAQKFKEHGFEENSFFLCEMSKEMLKINSELCNEALQSCEDLQEE